MTDGVVGTVYTGQLCSTYTIHDTYISYNTIYHVPVLLYMYLLFMLFSILMYYINYSSSSSLAVQLLMNFGLLNYFFPLLPLLHRLFPVLHSYLLQSIILTFSRLMTYIYRSYRTANLQTLHFIYLFNKYTY
jgi:hypothetical protein